MEIKKKHLLTFLFTGLIIYTITAFLLYSYNPFKLDEKYNKLKYYINNIWIYYIIIIYFFSIKIK